MTKRLTSWLGVFLVLSVNFHPAHGQMIFKTALQKKYDFKSVSCFTCHAQGKDANGKPLGKEHRNAFGKLIEKALSGKQATKRIDQANELEDSKAKKEALDKIAAEFLEALTKVEQLKSPEGPQWGELIHEGKLEGIKAKEPKPSASGR